MSALAISILTLVLLFLSVAGAGIFPWSLQTAALLLPAVTLPMLLSQPIALTPRQLRAPMGWLFLYTLLMIVPLNDFWHQCSPIRATANQTATAAIEQIGLITPLPSNALGDFALTRNRTGTLRFFLLITAGFSAWIIIRNASPRLRVRWLGILLLIGTLTAIVGMLGRWVFPQGDTLYWYISVPHGRPGPMGGFMNRNHFAGFLAILAPTALCFTCMAWERKSYLRAIAALAVTGLLTAGTLLSFSRGGTLALLAGLLATTCAIMSHSPWKTKRILLAAMAALLGGSILITWQLPALRTRLTGWDTPATQEAATDRWSAWQDTLQIARAYPILGAGPNAFRTVYPQHRHTSDRAARDFAENEYVQWLAETGLAGLLLALCFAMIITRRIWQYLRSNQTDAPNMLAPAAMGALAAAVMHATLDFPLRLPLYAITLVALAALLWPAPNSCFRQKATLPPIVVMGLGLLVALISLPANLRLDAPGTIASATPRQAIRTLHAAPTYPIAWRRLSAIHWQKNDPQHRALAVELLTQATAYDPNNYILWRTLGQRRQALGDHAGANAAYQRVRELRDWVRVPHLSEDP